MAVTLRDIAKESGFSKTAVWMALSDNRKLPEATRNKIKSVADEMGYRPNAAYRQMLRQVRSGASVNYRSTLGLLHAFDVADPEHHNDYHRSLVDGFEARAGELGYEVDSFWVNQEGLSGRRLSDIIDSRGIQGIALMPMPVHREIDLNWAKFAAVAVGYTLLSPKINRVNVNNQQASALCLSRLLHLGYERIGLVQSPEHENSRRYELSAPYLWMQSHLPVKRRTPPITVEANSRKAFLTWFNRHRFQALLTASPIVVEWLEEEGLSIPEDVGIVFPTPVKGYDGFSRIDQEPSRIGSATTDMLVAQLNRGELGTPANPKNLHTDVSFFEGASTRRVGEPLDDSLLVDIVRMTQEES